MAKLYFRPMPVLSVILVISIGILVSLGVWQYQRLQWKTALLTEIEASVTAPPLTSLEALQSGIEAGAPVDFRRIEFRGRRVQDGPEFHLYKSQQGGIYWDVVRPLASGELIVFVKTETLNAEEKAQGRADDDISVGPQAFTGYVRKVHPMGGLEGRIKSKANPAANRYFHFNQSGDWYQGLSDGAIKGYYIDIKAAPSAALLPVRRPEIANNHFDYMLTWWSFALIFLIIYLILHRRAGRLRFQ